MDWPWVMGAPQKSMNASSPAMERYWANTFTPVMRPCWMK
jgi:hypothetical protein